MEKMTLKLPDMTYLDQIAAYRQAFLDMGGSMDGTGPLRKTEDPAQWVQISLDMMDPAKTPQGRVPATQFIFVREQDNKLVGMLQIRHYFNDYLEVYGGHIGYSVHPSERRRGYAKEMLRLALPKCKELGLDRVLITCIDGNLGSERTILANGGVYDGTVHEPNENIDLKRFWIEV